MAKLLKTMVSMILKEYSLADALILAFQQAWARQLSVVPARLER